MVKEKTICCFHFLSLVVSYHVILRDPGADSGAEDENQNFSAQSGASIRSTSEIGMGMHNFLDEETRRSLIYIFTCKLVTQKQLCNCRFASDQKLSFTFIPVSFTD